MRHVKVSTQNPDWPLRRQTPGATGCWGGYCFHLDDDTRDCDAWFVLDELCEATGAVCAAKNVFLVTLEPPMIMSYDRRYLAQFARVFACRRGDLRHPRVTVAQQGLPWHVGRQERADGGNDFRLAYDELSAMPPPAKPRLLSLICSNKSGTPGHRRRQAFTRRLAAHFGDRLDIFGRGIRAIADKWDAIAPYRYHIALENSAVDHYWTEKLADAYLGWAFPFYAGCPNLAEYFPSAAFQPIDPRNARGAIAAIEGAIADDRYERALPALAQARARVLDTYNIFAAMAEWCDRFVGDAPKREILLRPHAAFRRPPSLARKACHRFARLILR